MSLQGDVRDFLKGYGNQISFSELFTTVVGMDSTIRHEPLLKALHKLKRQGDVTHDKEKGLWEYQKKQQTSTMQQKLWNAFRMKQKFKVSDIKLIVSCSNQYIQGYLKFLAEEKQCIKYIGKDARAPIYQFTGEDKPAYPYWSQKKPKITLDIEEVRKRLVGFCWDMLGELQIEGQVVDTKKLQKISDDMAPYMKHFIRSKNGKK